MYDSRRLILMPADIQDYVVVHELSHLRWDNELYINVK